MKDLLVLVADADAEAIMRAILERPQAMGIRPITFGIQRHPMRDSGVFTKGAELTRMWKGNYQYVLVMFDYHGSGCTATVDKCLQEVDSQLDRITWSGHYLVTILQPEVEEWLWQTKSSIEEFFNISPEKMGEYIGKFCKKYDCKNDMDSMARYPKELIDYICHQVLNKGHLLPRDYQKIASHASLVSWQKSPSFQGMVTKLQEWFSPA
ncbi:MAG: hypothetical protein G8345_15300 [Magnetococcales bacterium]|nr:hypothetical protein [Magnetococcales bacterium]